MNSRREDIYELHARICRALADPKRLLIIHELREGRKSVNDLATSLDLKQSNVSQHLATLRQCAIVEADREGQHVYYYLSNPKVLQALDILREILLDDLNEKRKLRDWYEGNLQGQSLLDEEGHCR